MKTIRKLTCLLLVTLLLTACGQTTPATPPKDHEQIIRDATTSLSRFSLEPVTVSHGEDYVIEWEDEGMEAHIRFLLDKPEGEILHSDVWDVQILTIQPGNGRPHDVMLTEPPEGWEHFEWEAVFWIEHKEGVWQEYGTKEFPDIRSLGDLRHFDSLQVFQADFTAAAPQVEELTGVEQCPNLVSLSLYYVKPASLAPLSQMPWLEALDLSSSVAVDLTPLEGLPKLRCLFLSECTLESLETVTTLPSLQMLYLNYLESYPSLEPLTRSTVEYLQLGLSIDGRGKFDSLDYAPLAKIPNLTYLDVSNHTAFNVDDCTAVLENSPNLKYLDICYTPAANAIKDGDWEPDFSQLEAYMTLPD